MEPTKEKNRDLISQLGEIDLKLIGEFLLGEECRLSDREKNIIEWVFFKNKTLKWCAQKLNISSPRVRELKIRSLRKAAYYLTKIDPVFLEMYHISEEEKKMLHIDKIISSWNEEKESLSIKLKELQKNGQKKFKKKKTNTSIYVPKKSE